MVRPRLASVGAKLALVTFPVLAALTAAVYFSLSHLAWEQMLESKEHSARMAGGLFLRSLSAPVFFDDRKLLRETAGLMLQDPEVLGVELWQAREVPPGGALIASQFRDPHQRGVAPRWVEGFEVERQQNRILFRGAVRDVDQQIIGMAAIQYSLAHENGLLSQLRQRILLGCAGVAVFIAMLLSFLTGRFVTGPLARLLEAVKEVEAGRCVDLGGIGAMDEVGHLAEAFSRMGQAVERREQDVLRRNAELREALNTTEQLLQAVPYAAVVVGKDGIIQRANDAASNVLKTAGLPGRAWSDFVGSCPRELPPTAAGECAAVDAGGRPLSLLLSEIPVTVNGTEVVIEAFIDFSERKQLEAQLRHSQKLEAVGQLAAGIAHEINTPAQFIGDSIHFLAGGFAQTLELLRTFRGIFSSLAAAPGYALAAAQLEQAEKAADLAYLEDNCPRTFQRAQEGIQRIATQVSAMKRFAHPGSAQQKSPADLNRELEATLTIARHEYKYVAKVEVHLGELPRVLCHAGDINQVLLNLLVNAAHAISDVVGQTGQLGLIRVRSVHEGEFVRIEVEDSGCGIPEAIQDRVFDPFFTTKELGRGTGQGLAIARSIIVDKHAGSLTFVSEVGKGTTFSVVLPVGGNCSPGRQQTNRVA